MTKFKAQLDDLKNALNRLEEILEKEKDAIVRDSAIKRFEIVFDLIWKTLKTFLEEQHNVTCVSPKTCFKEAFNKGLIDYDKFWLEIADLRNETAHVYKEKLAEKVYDQFNKVLSYFQKLFEKISSQGV